MTGRRTDRPRGMMPRQSNHRHERYGDGERDVGGNPVLTLLGFGMVITFMALIMTKRLSPMVALILIPVLFALVGGFGGPKLGEMMIDGVKTLAPTGVMLMFAILYFGIMID
eukprot:gene15627-19964_t